jgi:hypothetical protein
MAKEQSTKDSVLYDPFVLLFQTLSTNEVTQFEDYVKVFTKENNALKVLAYCKEHKKDSDDTCWEKAVILKKVFADKNDKSRKLREALNSLNEHLEHFLLFQIAKEDRNRELLLIEVFRRRKLPEQAKMVLERATALNEARIWDIWKKIPLGDKSYYDNTDGKSNKLTQELFYTLEKIQEFTTTITWKYACEIAIRNQIGLLTDEKLLALQQLPTKYENKWSKLYRKCYYLINDPKEDNFREMYSLFELLDDTDEEAVCILGFLLNIGINLYRNGQLSSTKELIDLVKLGQKRKIIDFENMTTDLLLIYVAFLCGECFIQEAQHIVETFQQQQPNQVRAILLAESIIHLYKNEAYEARNKLKRVKPKSKSEQFLQKIILTCCNFSKSINQLKILHEREAMAGVNYDEATSIEDAEFNTRQSLYNYLSKEITKTNSADLMDKHKIQLQNLLKTLRTIISLNRTETDEELENYIYGQTDLPAKKWILQNLKTITKIVP